MNDRIDRDFDFLAALDDLKVDAVALGLCPAPFDAIKHEVLRLMGERDGYKYRLKELAEKIE